jgi:hypothetical protein
MHPGARSCPASREAVAVRNGSGTCRVLPPSSVRRLRGSIRVSAAITCSTGSPWRRRNLPGRSPRSHSGEAVRESREQDPGVAGTLAHLVVHCLQRPGVADAEGHHQDAGGEQFVGCPLACRRAISRTSPSSQMGRSRWRTGVAGTNRMNWASGSWASRFRARWISSGLAAVWWRRRGGGQSHSPPAWRPSTRPPLARLPPRMTRPSGHPRQQKQPSKAAAGPPRLPS